MDASSLEQQTETHPRIVLAVVGVGTLLNTLAGSSINLALPVIGNEMSITVELSRWIVLSFMLVGAVLLLGAGRASDLWGHRRVYQAGFVVFGAGSLVCGLAPTFWALVAGRVLQGVGASMNMSASPALLTTSFPGAQRGRALGLLATATYTGLTVGPPFGGLLIDAAGWRWIFLLNVPVALVMVTAGQLFLPRGARREVRFDRAGMAALVLALPLLLVALTQGSEWGWRSPLTLGSAGAGLALAVVFVRVELGRAEPLLDLRLFRSATFSGAVISAFCNYVAIFVPIILIPFYLLEALELGASRAGMLLSIMPLVMALVASPAGWLSDRLGTRGFAVLGLGLQTVALLGLGLSGICPREQCSLVQLGLWLALMGLGTGVFITPNSSALMGAAPRAQQGIAGGVLALARTTGMMTGVSLGTAAFRALGGRTGASWGEASLRALAAALMVGAAVSFVGALAAALRGRSRSG